MSVKLYDEALLKKFKYWTAGTHITLTGVNEAKRLFEVLADSQNDSKLKLPIISLSRPGGYTILNKNKRVITHDGATMLAGNGTTAKLNVIPIGIAYQIDIYTRYLEEADEYARNLIFNIINYPKLTIEIPYENQGLTHDANIRIVSEVDDNSDIPERLTPGQFTRLTLGINIDDAYLFDVRIRDNLRLVDAFITDEENNVI